MLDFEKVFEENRQFILRYLIKLCKNTSLAEELTQETFFRAYMNMAGLRNEEKVSAWLCQIAKNTYFAYLGDSKKTLPLEEQQISESTPDIATLFAEKELSDKAFSCLHALEEPYKEVFMLRVFGELEYAQIAKLFAKTESWARVTYHRAKMKITESLRESEEK